MWSVEEVESKSLSKTPELSHTLLAGIIGQPDCALQLLLSEKGGVFRKSRIHTLLVLIEQNLYQFNESAFLKLQRWEIEKWRIKAHIFQVKEKLVEQYGTEKAHLYMQNLIKSIFPEQAEIFDTLTLQ